jgi:hypothetical protein
MLLDRRWPEARDNLLLVLTPSNFMLLDRRWPEARDNLFILLDRRWPEARDSLLSVFRFPLSSQRYRWDPLSFLSFHQVNCFCSIFHRKFTYFVSAYINVGISFAKFFFQQFKRTFVGASK